MTTTTTSKRPDNKHLVFVYGTLREGQRLNPVFARHGSDRVRGFFETCEDFNFTSCGPFPAMHPTGSITVVGEVYRVSDECLAELDRIEGVPYHYMRKTIKVQRVQADVQPTPITVHAYVQKDETAKGRRVIESGDWLDFVDGDPDPFVSNYDDEVTVEEVVEDYEDEDEVPSWYDEGPGEFDFEQDFDSQEDFETKYAEHFGFSGATTTSAHDDERIPYFAYGSNLDPDQMTRRCPSSELVGAAYLEGHRIGFAGKARLWNGGAVATVRPCANERVEGLVWTISRRDLKALDRCEGWPFTYTRDRMRLRDAATGRFTSAWVYVHRAANRGALPSIDYAAQIVTAYHRRHFDLAPLVRALVLDGGNEGARLRAAIQSKGGRFRNALKATEDASRAILEPLRSGPRKGRQGLLRLIPRK